MIDRSDPRRRRLIGLATALYLKRIQEYERQYGFQAAIAYVSGTGGVSAGSSGTIAATAFSVTTGNALFAWVQSYTNGNQRTVSQVTDTAGNSYTRQGNIEHGDSNHSAECWAAFNITGNASNTVTATFSGNAQNRDINVVQYSGIATSSAFDQAAALNIDAGTPTSHTTNTTGTTAQADEVVIGYFIAWNIATPYTPSATSPYNLRRVNTDSSFVADRIVAATGTYSVTASTTQAGQLAMMVRTFKAAAAASLTYPQLERRTRGEFRGQL